MSARLRRRLVAGSAAAVVGVLALNATWPLPGHEHDWPWVIGLMAFPVAAALVLSRRPGNPVGRLLGLVAVSAGAIFLLGWYVQALPDAPLSRELEAIETIPAVLQFAGILGLLHLFPTGRPAGRVHGWVVRAMWAYFAGFALLGVVRPGPMTLTGRSNPFGIAPPWVSDAWRVGPVGMLPLLLLGLWVVVARWRGAGPMQRAQLKWFYAGAVWVALAALLNVVPAGGDSAVPPVIDVLVGAGVVVAFWSLPLAVVVAITRYRLFEIDRVISRTLGYALVAGVVGVVYAASVVGLQIVLPVGGSDLAVAASTLAAAAAFGPVRRRVQRAVERRFNRARYDRALVVDAFAGRTGHHADVDRIASELRAVVGETMQPASVALWLRAPPGRG